MSDRILILGGTKEAAALAKQLVEDGHIAITSLAGRTKEPAPLAGQTRIGGFGGAAGLADYLKAQNITRMIDATHPFARQISRNAVEAAQRAGVPLDVRTRQPWQRQPSDIWHPVGSLEEAAASLEPGERVLLALGSQHLASFYARNDVFFLVRMVDAPDAPLPFANHDLLAGKPGATVREEMKVLNAHDITRIVCRNSGGSGAYAKIEAARELGLPVTIVAR